MGEVFLATAPESLQRVVVKRILPSLTENARFLRLFLDETRIAARLAHPNIARILELGEDRGVWFVAMEYVDGRDLRSLMGKVRDDGLSVPVGAALRIASQVALGLDYAHRSTDSNGRPLSVVHRDISPHNILISSQGDVKIIDFGVAKAANRTTHTASGVLKGKFPYMSPEQAHGRRVDARTDLFALGIVTWEMLTGQYLFKGKSDPDTLRRVRACHVPRPSQFVEGIPLAIEQVVLKALERQPKDRYPHARAMHEALEEVLTLVPADDVKDFYDSLVNEDDEGGLPSALSERPKSWSTGTALTHVSGSTGSRPTDVTRSDRPERRTNSVEMAVHDALELLAEVAGVRRTNVVLPSNIFVGRVAELADLHQLFRQGARVITLVGSAGTGKTRLALQFVGQLVSHYGPKAKSKTRRGGAWFCDVSDVRDTQKLCDVIAHELDIPLAAVDPVAQIGHALRSRGEILLLIDNCERAVAVVRDCLERWVRIAPNARFVLTSREVLAAPLEAVFEVPPLRVPEPSEPVATAEAVQLFIARARAVRPDFAVTPAEEGDVAKLVDALDGLPLAIELAAARMADTTPGGLLAELPRGFAALGDSTGHSLHGSTLGEAIDWSWQMLPLREALTLAQCSVFRGGFTVEAAEAVVDLTRAGDEADVMTSLMTLRTKSLVRLYYANDGSDARYGLLESIRSYSEAKLREMPEANGARERHARFFTALGLKLAQGAEGSPSVLSQLDLERDNLMAVFQRAVATGRQGARALMAVLGLDPLLSLRGPFGEHLPMLDEALLLLAPGDVRHRAQGLEARGRVCLTLGRVTEAFGDFQSMLALARKEGAAELEARAESYLGVVARLQDRRADARRHLTRALELHREVSDRRSEGRTLSHFSMLFHELGQEEPAREYGLTALRLHREVGDRRYEGVTLGNLGILLQSHGRLDEARASGLAALEIHRELGNIPAEGLTHIALGNLSRELSQPAQSAAHFRQALHILGEAGSPRLEGIAHTSLGGLYLELGRLADAEQSFRQALAAFDVASEQLYSGLAHGGLAAAVALTGRLDEGEKELGTATEILRAAAAPAFLDALDIYRAHVELAYVMSATPARATELRAKVSARIRHAEGEPNPVGVGRQAPAARSEFVRAALRSYRTAERIVQRAISKPPAKPAPKPAARKSG